ncbi:MAG: T9SS type A sorting domain-containing protein [Bacteroidota bacterium]
MFIRTTCLIGLIIIVFTSSQAQVFSEEWEHFPIIGDFAGATETETDIWLAHRYGLLRWNKAQQQLSTYEENYLSGRFYNTSHVFSRNGEHYLLGEYSLHQLVGESWRNLWGGFGAPQTALPDLTAIVGINDYGILAQSAEGYIYTIDTEHDVAWTELSPWNNDWWPERSFYQTEDGTMWAWSPQRLVRWRGEDLEEFTVPVAGDSIITAVPGTDQYRWVVSDQHLSYRHSSWTNVPLANLSPHPLTYHRVLDEHSIFLAFDAEVMTLQFANDQFEIIHHETYLGHKRPGSELFLMDNGDLWYMDHLLKQHHYFTANWNLTTVEEHNWVPTSVLSSTHITQDREGRIWVCTRDRTVFYAGEKWYAAEEAYPGFPRGTAQLRFTTDGTPIIFSPKISSTNATASLRQYRNGRWGNYPLPDDGDGLSPADATQMLLDREDNIWLYTPRSTVVFTWDRNSWITISTVDFPSRPSTFTSIAFDQDNNLLLSTIGGIIKHDRRWPEFYSLSDLGISCLASFNNKLVADSQNNFWLGGFGLCKWSFDQAGEAIELPVPLQANNYFYGIYPFAEDELWLMAESFSYGHVTVGPDATGELSLVAHYFRPEAPDIGEALIRDKLGRIWALDRNSIMRFTRPESNLPTSTSTNGKLRAYPNPSCCQVHLKWQSEDSGPAQLQLYNTQGQLVYDLVKQNGHLGPQQLVVPRGELPAGVYFAVLYQGSRTEMVKIIFE